MEVYLHLYFIYQHTILVVLVLVNVLQIVMEMVVQDPLLVIRVRLAIVLAVALDQVYNVVVLLDRADHITVPEVVV